MNSQLPLVRTLALWLAVCATPGVLAVCLDPRDPSKYFQPTLEQELASANAIVVGTVLSAKGLNEDKTDPGGWTSFIYTFEVSQLLLGNVPMSIELSATNDSGGYRMSVGETHLLFLSKRDTRLSVNPCGNSTALPKGQAVFEQLQSLLRARPHAA